mgnify:CR=1 FL=1
MLKFLFETMAYGSYNEKAFLRVSMKYKLSPLLLIALGLAAVSFLIPAFLWLALFSRLEAKPAPSGVLA